MNANGSANTAFSPTSYTNVIHSQGLDDYFVANYNRPSPDSMFTHLKLDDEQENISPINSNEIDNDNDQDDGADVGDDFDIKNENYNKNQAVENIAEAGGRSYRQAAREPTATYDGENTDRVPRRHHRRGTTG